MNVNSADPNEAKKLMLAELERLGPQQVRDQIRSGKIGQNSTLVEEWLANKDRETARTEAASQAEIAATAARSAAASERAAAAVEAQAQTAKKALRTSIVATIVALLALIVSVLVALRIM